ncbi:hypothetical protein FA15DRAFT_704751 [Coprinopsis marcescibilis]|uniref:F-box domain-containing protein n=1 Tax=Coprinopsis marcescibilis TaxID=230819 RepID=A0A5C3L7J1_COPMA|nr:hypothetical protein FA15DRAFT_704751 [Coprinopsis marcescibilis]
MDTIPTEVLEEIFLLCLPDTLDASIPSSRCAPLLLTHISSRWRTIASNYRKLWTSLRLVPNRATSVSASPDVEFDSVPDAWNYARLTHYRFHRLFDHWIARCVPRPIALSIEIPAISTVGFELYRSEFDELWKDLFDCTLLAHHSDIGLLRIEENIWTVLNHVFTAAAAKSRFPNLQMVTVDTYRYTSSMSHYDSREMALTPSFPQLLMRINLDLGHFVLNGFNALKRSSLQNLTHLCIQKYPFNKSITRNVDSRQLAFVGDDQRLVTMRMLKQLDVLFRSRDTHSESEFFQKVNCPKLEVLATRTVAKRDDKNWDSPWTGYGSRLTAEDAGSHDRTVFWTGTYATNWPPRSLQSLFLSQGYRVSVSSLINALVLLDNLVTLVLESDIIDYDPLFECLTTDPTIIPDVKRFELRLHHPYPCQLYRGQTKRRFTWKKYSEMAASRVWDDCFALALRPGSWWPQVFLWKDHPLSSAIIQGDLSERGLLHEEGEYNGPKGKLSALLTIVDADTDPMDNWDQPPLPQWIEDENIE